MDDIKGLFKPSKESLVLEEQADQYGQYTTGDSNTKNSEEDIDLEKLISEMEQTEKEIKGLKSHVDRITEKIQKSGTYKGKGAVKTVNNEGRVEYKLVTEQSTLRDIKNKEGKNETQSKNNHIDSFDVFSNTIYWPLCC